jgi:uncharacterized membrane protein (DUF2068 family)
VTPAASELPGTAKPRRFVPKFHWELIVCGIRGHELLGTDAARLRPEDALFARDSRDVRWLRCLRCDSWLPLRPPASPQREYPPARDEVEVPLRGRALRDKVVLRIIAIDRAVHFVVLAGIAVAVFVFAANRDQLRAPVYRVLTDVQNGLGGPPHGHGLLYDVRRVFSVSNGTLTKIGLVVATYALLEGAEAIGLWFQKRWAEYLTFVATTALLPLEIYELAHSVTPFKVIALVVNLAIVGYLLLAKRLFGIRGGAAADEAERRRDSGWEALERATPGGVALPA